MSKRDELAREWASVKAIAAVGRAIKAEEIRMQRSLVGLECGLAGFDACLELVLEELRSEEAKGMIRLMDMNPLEACDYADWLEQRLKGGGK